MSQYCRLASNEKQKSVIETIENWAKKIHKPICNAYLIGKDHNIIIFDLSYHGCEIYIHANGWENTDDGSPGVTVNNVHITGPNQFKLFKISALKK